jgi:hypothetical protein
MIERREQIERDLLTPLVRFVKRSRVKPTEGQIEHALGLIECLNAALSEQKEKAEREARRREHTEAWYAVRLRHLEDFFRGAGKDLPVAAEFWNIIANGRPGTPENYQPPTYAQMLNQAKHRVEHAEASLATQTQEIGQLRLERDSAREQFDKHIEWASDQLASLTRERDAMQAAMAGGVGLIAAERQHQVSQEGWTPEHDDGHVRCELALAAAEYLQAGMFRPTRDRLGGASELVPSFDWPWSVRWWKPSDDPIRNLVKAGALIAAEIDRLQRAAPLSSLP